MSLPLAILLGFVLGAVVMLFVIALCRAAKDDDA
jgi:hypothetical protein